MLEDCTNIRKRTVKSLEATEQLKFERLFRGIVLGDIKCSK